MERSNGKRELKKRLNHSKYGVASSLVINKSQVVDTAFQGSLVTDCVHHPRGVSRRHHASRQFHHETIEISRSLFAEPPLGWSSSIHVRGPSTMQFQARRSI
jgi:hypothetical protein